MKEAASALRHHSARAARKAVPPTRRYRVAREKPLLLEAYGSDDQLNEDDDDFEVSRGVRFFIEKGDDVLVGHDSDGDRFIVAVCGDGDDAEPWKKEREKEKAEEDEKAKALAPTDHAGAAILFPEGDAPDGWDALDADSPIPGYRFYTARSE